MNIAIVGVAWYKREDYETLKRLSLDGDKFPATYDQWLERAERACDQFRRKGQAFQKVHVDAETFPDWCKARGLDIDAQARTRFCAESVARADGH